MVKGYIDEEEIVEEGKKNFRKKVRRAGEILQEAGRKVERGYQAYEKGAERVVKAYGRVQRKARKISKRIPKSGELIGLQKPKISTGELVGMPTGDGRVHSTVATIAGIPTPAPTPKKKVPKKKKKERYRSPLW